MNRILFVDDEPKILTGLRRMLRSMRREWEMEFAEGGYKALELLQQQTFDVVVSDARMPGMEGSELLERVRHEYPDTVRMILSGQCGRDSVLRCVGAAHQFLSKPCDPEALKDAIRNVCRLRQRVCDAEARGAVSRIDSLPSRRESHAALARQAETEATPLRQMAETVCADVGMSMKVVQLVSSGFFGTPQHTIDVERATELLGADTLRELVTATNAFRPAEAGEIDQELLAQVQQHSLAVAAAARRIAETVTNDRNVITQAYLAGLFHEVGALVPARPSLRVFPSHCEEANEAACMCEFRAGGYLAALWGLPFEVAIAVGSHRCPDENDCQGFTALTAVHVADACIEGCPALHERDSGELNRDYLARVGCSDRVSQWQEICHAIQPSEVLV